MSIFRQTDKNFPHPSTQSGPDSQTARIRLVIPEEVVVQPCLTVGVLVLQAERVVAPTEVGYGKDNIEVTAFTGDFIDGHGVLPIWGIGLSKNVFQITLLHFTGVIGV